MKRHLISRLGVWLLACAALAAAEFWETKPFLEWSDKEAQKLLGDSPWAGVVTVPLPPQLPSAAQAGGGGGRGGGDDMSFGPGPRRVPVTVSWRTALPVRRAYVRSQVGPRGEVPAPLQEFLTQEPTSYVVALSGVPAQYTRPGSGTTLEAFLRRDGKPPIPAVEGGMEKGRTGIVLLIGFARTDVIGVEDREVEFAAKIGPLEIKKKFKLKEMLFEGKLEL